MRPFPDGKRNLLTQVVNSSPHQLSYVTHSGEGLIVYGDTILPFLDHFNKESRLYQVMTTKPSGISDGFVNSEKYSL